MIELTTEIAAIGAVNEMLMDMVNKRTNLREVFLTPKLVCSYVLMLEFRSGFLVSQRFNSKSLDALFRSRKDVFQMTLSMNEPPSYRFRIEKFLNPAELAQARFAPLTHPCVVSIIAQMMDALGEKCEYPLGFLKRMRLEDSLRMKKV